MTRPSTFKSYLPRRFAACLAFMPLALSGLLLASAAPTTTIPTRSIRSSRMFPWARPTSTTCSDGPATTRAAEKRSSSPLPSPRFPRPASSTPTCSTGSRSIRIGALRSRDCVHTASKLFSTRCGQRQVLLNLKASEIRARSIKAIARKSPLSISRAAPSPR